MSSEKRFCTFFLGDMFFGVEVEKVQEVLRFQKMTFVPRAPSVVEGLINLRGQIVTAIDLRRRLEFEARPEGSSPINVVLKTAEGAVSLLVDKIGDVLELDDSSYERPPETLSGVARELIRGAFKLEDRLLLILDTEEALNF